jgi:hypothetical protein
VVLIGVVAFALWGCDDDGNEPDCDDVEHPCEEAGARQCADDGSNAIWECREREDSCLAWAEVEACSEAQDCTAVEDVPTCVCDDECETEGAIYCVGDVVVECVSDGGCLVQEDQADCAAEGQTCEEGVDGARCTGCEDLCDEDGAQQCYRNVVQTCGISGDGCLDWLDEEDCDETGTECVEDGGEASCETTCEDQCDAEGDMRCQDNNAEICSEMDTGCLDWEVAVECNPEEGETCEMIGDTAECVGCTDECDEGTSRCAEDVLETCVRPEDGCAMWEVDTDCTTTGVGGHCVTLTDSEATCMWLEGGDSCDDPMVVDSFPFDLSGEDFTAMFADDMTVNGEGCVEFEDAGVVEAVFAVDMTAGQVLRLRELGEIDVVMSVMSTCEEGAACLLSEDLGELDGHLYTADADGRVFVIVEAYYPDSDMVAFDFRMDLGDREVCDDLVDNDLDALADCDDSDCFGIAPCDVAELNCRDDADNDVDGMTDCEDTDCMETYACIPEHGIYQLFDVEDVDLVGHSLTFTPNDTAEFDYSYVVADGVDAFGYEVGSGTATRELVLRDDGFEEYRFANLPSFEFYGTTYGTVFVSSNGYLTFGRGSDAFTTSVEAFFTLPIIAGLRSDLDPTHESSGGDPVVTVDDSAERVVVTYQNVPRWYFGDPTGPNDVQIALNADGTIEIFFVNIDAETAIVGIGAGSGTGEFPAETDFVEAPPEACDDDEDNDFDGLVDCDDSDCFGVAPCDLAELNCTDGEDNDGDTATDCADTDCAADPTCLPRRGIFQLFDDEAIDLAGHSITFTPAVDGFTWEVGDDVVAFPYAVGTGTATAVLDLDDDASAEYTFANLPEFELYGTAYASVFVSSNGYLTFGEGSESTSTSVDGFFALPIVAGLRRDLDPSSPSTAGDAVVTVDDSAERLVVTFQNVPRYTFGDPPGPNDFQMALNADGSIELYYINIDAPTAIVGIGSGDDTGTYPDETDFVVILGEVCDDDVDNDGDLLADCDDPDCFGVAPCDVAELNCDDDADNDGDHLADCDDPDCFGVAPCDVAEANCTDGEDNDGDTLIDCEDTDCAADLSCLRTGIYEIFDVIFHADPTDIAGHSITFTPAAGDPAGYTWETDGGIDAFPYAVGTGTATETLDLGNDEAVEYDFVNLPEFELYGIAYSSVFVSSNGCLTFGAGSSATPNINPAIDLGAFFSLPVVAGLRRDLDPTLPSTAGDPVITIDDSAGRLVVTYQNIPRFYGADPTGPNDFQMVLNADGSVEIYYVAVNVPTAIVGIGSGGVAEPFPAETNFVLP